ncbi:hypothetical protein AB0C34_17880 [Nocardia sp. NPDC049220]|uniref:hypothetical protein n=1 Tax=Nocardia sp. NPDC049220 TaxID=3155273 RepID=UPI0033F2C0AC
MRTGCTTWLEWESKAQVVAVDYIGFASNLSSLDAVIDHIVFEKADIAEPSRITTARS